MRTNKVGFALAFVVLAACKDKADKAAPEQAPQAGSAAGSAVGSAAASQTAVKLSGGEAKFGCIGWAPATKTAACVTGVTQANEPSVYHVSYIGSSEPPTKLALGPDESTDVLDDASVTSANATLAELDVQPFPAPGKRLEVAATAELGKGASLVWTAVETDKGGENQAPTVKHTAAVKCATGTAELVASEAEGVNPTFEVWQLGDHALIAIEQRMAREGEYGAEASAVLVDLATCNVKRS